MKSNKYDAVIIGGGIMGLLGAYEIVRSGGRVAVVERSTIGNAQAGSSGLTRSIRSDYENEQYAALARLSWDKWKALEQEFGEQLVLPMGCLNLGVTGGELTYAEVATRWLQRDGREPLVLTGTKAVQKRFPQFVGFDYGVFEAEAGLGFPLATLQKLTYVLASAERCTLFENTSVSRIGLDDAGVTVATSVGLLKATKLIVAAGLGTPQVLGLIEGRTLQLPLTADRPAECLYYIPKDPAAYTSTVLPTFACLDMGMYGHPVVEGRTKGVKIGRYHPPASVNKGFEAGNGTLDDFVRRYMPELAATSKVLPVTDTDQCAYDMTPDGGFAIGTYAAAPQVFVAAGFCGTGYKFAPVVAELISDFAVDKPLRYDVSVFDPERFEANR